MLFSLAVTLLVTSVTSVLSQDNSTSAGGAGSLKHFLGANNKSARQTLSKEERFQAKLASFDNKTLEIKNHTEFLQISGVNLNSSLTELNTDRPLAYLQEKVL